jgi:uncharacterized membrane protein YgdD (TMEM256/DUF423 family)
MHAGSSDDPGHGAARWLAFAGISLALATMLGAFGTHALKPVLPPARFESFESGVSYQFFHTLGLLVIALLRARRDSALLRWSARLVVAGLVLFCGSIYALTFGAPRFLGMVAPLGGASFMLAWLLFALSLWREGLSPDRR